MSKQRLNEVFLICGLLVVISALAYLPLAGQLGYYHDDWFTVASKVSGVSLGDMHYVDRPLMGKVYEITRRLLGDRPLNWHLFAFAARTFGSLVFFGIFSLVWPGQRTSAFAAAALFAVYPGFLQQTNANNYSNHLIALATGLFSIFLSLLALSASSRVVKAGLILFAALLAVFYPAVYETTIGLEGMRLILFAYVLLRGTQRSRRDFLSVALYSLPFVLSAGAFLVWRLFVFNSVRLGTDAGLLFEQYANQPLGMAARILLETGKDFIETVFFAWIVPLYQSLTGLGYGDLVLALLLAAAAAVLLVGYSRRGLAVNESVEAAPGREMIWLGGLVVLVTLLPVSLAGRDVQFSYNLNRYTLQSMAGVAILLVGLIQCAVRPGLRWWLAGVLVALAVCTHYANAAYHRDFWQIQRSFWWQMTWRAPGLEPETVLVGSLPAGYRVAEDFEVWAPANLIYYPAPGMGVNDPIGVMAHLLTPETVVEAIRGESAPRNFRQISYSRRMDKTLVFSMSAPDSCVHLVDGQQVELPYNADPLVFQAAGYSLIRGIQTEAQPAQPPAEMFGAEPERSWCYYYQKAGLARQKGDWQEVTRLAEEADQQGLAPADVSEWLPFYEAYTVLDQPDRAAELAEKIQSNPYTWDRFCQPFRAGEDGKAALVRLCQKP